ncbi:winged helix DNA-binding domain-containing protein [Membranihabitans maritimus]|uniref:winged helix DNA-binding domain-containing protein n=1 Tax=Membranihabitans maritimus TaxID=2904244 RepID=UPI001F439E53|nr:winged helix DNA-binding domain-containing protein [Membranihabitans maritimus]
MKHKELSLLRLHNQCLGRQPFTLPEEVVRWMGAMQAQDYLGVLWAVALRTGKEITEADVEKAIGEGKIVRTWPMRGTLHLLAPEDVKWMLELLTPRILKSAAGRHRDLELDKEIFMKSGNVFEKALSGEKHLTRDEMYTALERSGISTEGQRGYHILWYWGQNGLICWGPRQGKQHTFVLLDEWVSGGKDLTGDEALDELTRRYVRSHGPITERDFAYWAGTTLTDARKGLEILGKEVEKVEIDGQNYFFTGDFDYKKVKGTVHLLPPFDEILTGYKDRSAVLKSQSTQSIILRNGIIKSIIVDREAVVGSWKRKLKKDKVEMEFEFFEELSTTKRVKLERMGRKYGRFLGRVAEWNL